MTTNSIYVFANLCFNNRAPLKNYTEPLLNRIPNEKRDEMRKRMNVDDGEHIVCDSWICRRFRAECTCTKTYYATIFYATSDREPVFKRDPSNITLEESLWDANAPDWRDGPSYGAATVRGHRADYSGHGSDPAWSRTWDTVEVSNADSANGVTLWIPLENGLYEWSVTGGGYDGGRVSMKTGLGRIEWNKERTKGRLFKSL